MVSADCQTVRIISTKFKVENHSFDYVEINGSLSTPFLVCPSVASQDGSMTNVWSAKLALTLLLRNRARSEK